jgi:hypothetical protein
MEATEREGLDAFGDPAAPEPTALELIQPDDPSLPLGNRRNAGIQRVLVDFVSDMDIKSTGSARAPAPSPWMPCSVP